MARSTKSHVFQSSTADIRQWEYRRALMVAWLGSIPAGDGPMGLEDARSLLSKGVPTYDGYVRSRVLYENAWLTYSGIRPRPKRDRKAANRLAMLGYALSFPPKDWKPMADETESMPWVERLEKNAKRYLGETSLLMFNSTKPSPRRARTQAQIAYSKRVVGSFKGFAPAKDSFDSLDPAFQAKVDEQVALHDLIRAERGAFAPDPHFG